MVASGSLAAPSRHQVAENDSFFSHSTTCLTIFLSMWTWHFVSWHNSRPWWDNLDGETNSYWYFNLWHGISASTWVGARRSLYHVFLVLVMCKIPLRDMDTHTTDNPSQTGLNANVTVRFLPLFAVTSLTCVMFRFQLEVSSVVHVRGSNVSDETKNFLILIMFPR